MHHLCPKDKNCSGIMVGKDGILAAWWRWKVVEKHCHSVCLHTLLTVSGGFTLPCHSLNAGPSHVLLYKKKWFSWRTISIELITRTPMFWRWRMQIVCINCLPQTTSLHLLFPATAQWNKQNCMREIDDVALFWPQRKSLKLKIKVSLSTGN